MIHLYSSEVTCATSNLFRLGSSSSLILSFSLLFHFVSFSLNFKEKIKRENKIKIIRLRVREYQEKERHNGEGDEKKKMRKGDNPTLFKLLISTFYSNIFVFRWSMIAISCV